MILWGPLGAVAIIVAIDFALSYQLINSAEQILVQRFLCYLGFSNGSFLRLVQVSLLLPRLPLPLPLYDTAVVLIGSNLQCFRPCQKPGSAGTMSGALFFDCRADFK